ncbi:MAG TPA: hypothetical protein VIM76_05935 [Candidatus Dormibacteraeota bacterium]
MRRLLIAGLLGTAMVTGVASGSAPATAATTCLTTTYISLLDTADSALSAVPPRPVAAVTALTQAAGLVPSSSALLGPIIAGLTSTPPDVAGGRQRLDLLATTLALPPGSACNVESQAARNLLHSVYASPVFADLDQKPAPSWFERIGAAINWVLSHLYGLLGSGGSLALGLVVLALIAAFVIYRLRGVLGGRSSTAAEEPATAGEDPEREWRLALAAAERGDHREAIRRAFRSALLDISGRRARIDRAWTTREMLATLSADADLLAVLAPAAAAFDSAWYGAEPVGAAQWEIARARCEAVRQIARHASGAPAA